MFVRRSSPPPTLYFLFLVRGSTCALHFIRLIRVKKNVIERYPFGNIPLDLYFNYLHISIRFERLTGWLARSLDLIELIVTLIIVVTRCYSNSRLIGERILRRFFSRSSNKIIRLSNGVVGMTVWEIRSSNLFERIVWKKKKKE